VNGKLYAIAKVQSDKSCPDVANVPPSSVVRVTLSGLGRLLYPENRNAQPRASRLTACHEDEPDDNCGGYYVAPRAKNTDDTRHPSNLEAEPLRHLKLGQQSGYRGAGDHQAHSLVR
jgi:hypothetical protein